MAEGGQDSTPGCTNSWESWLGGWVQTAKEKSSTALEFMKKDLSEFTCTMQKETEKVVEITSSTLKGDKLTQNTATATNKVKAGFSLFLDNISKVLVIPPEDDEGVPMKVASDGSGLYDRGKARLHALQLDASTYMDPPRGPPEQYKMWVESFNMDEYKGEISELLVSKVEVRALYTKLVPNEVSHAEFWQRYFYRVHQLDCDEARKQALMKRADDVKGEAEAWDDDDWSAGEEDDEGSQSDWEKMPRPPQSQAAVQASAQESKGPTSAEYITPDQAKPDTDDLQDQISVPVTNNTIQQADSQESSVAALPSSVCSEPPSLPTQSPSVSSSQATATAVDMSAAAQQDQAETEEVKIPEVQRDLWSLHIPEDTASGSNVVEVSQDSEPGSTSDVSVAAPVVRNIPAERRDLPVTEDNSGACAAAAVEESRVSDSTSQEVSVAGGACGASDLYSSTTAAPLVAPDMGDLDVPAASEDTPASNQESSPSVEPETVSEPPAASEEEETDGNSSEQQQLTDTPLEPAAPPQAEQQCTEQADLSTAEASSAEPVPAPENTIPVVQSDQDLAEQINVRVKGDMVVVGDRGSPSSDSSDGKELGEDWEEDFDIEVTEEDLKAAEDLAKKLGENMNEGEDDWENWE